jgi:rRNA maturation endonuclease Nob1
MMGYPEQPITKRMKYGRLRRYKCRVCGRSFKDYYLPEDRRVCARCVVQRDSQMSGKRPTQVMRS